MRELKVTFLPAYSGSYFQLLAYPRRVTTAGGTTAGGAAWLILHILTPGALPDATPKGFVSPPGIKPGIFCLLGECGNHLNCVFWNF